MGGQPAQLQAPSQGAAAEGVAEEWNVVAVVAGAAGAAVRHAELGGQAGAALGLGKAGQPDMPSLEPQWRAVPKVAAANSAAARP